MSAAADFHVPPVALAAIVRVESRGRSVVATNRNGTQDLGVAGLNTASWVRYMGERYGIPVQALKSDVCQNVRVAAYALRWEQNHRACAGQDIWCGIGRYHAPNNAAARAVYVAKVAAAIREMLSTGRFE